MDQSEHADRQPPWWYGIPPVALFLMVYAVSAIFIFTMGSESGIAWASGGVVIGLAAAVVHGAAQAAYDRRHR
ncbi:hypothetical protein ACFWGI_06785 [Streptomyces niveus]|uniref:hypothetical protein n=1 Tax=Streptomyces niveus TaxID=193462 RepID=UPI003666AC67